MLYLRLLHWTLLTQCQTPSALSKFPLPKRKRVGFEAGVENFDFSSHCNRDEMIDYMKKARPKTVFLVHGDTNALHWFEEKLKGELPGARIIIPEPGREYEI